jgi:predicted GNAT superfamily acetyltransferase
MSLARDWRLATRKIFEKAFSSGYMVTDFVHAGGRGFYILALEDSPVHGLEPHANLRG